MKFGPTDNPENASGKASLNGEDQYQFSARAMLDRFKKERFDLGWFKIWAFPPPAVPSTALPKMGSPERFEPKKPAT